MFMTPSTALLLLALFAGFIVAGPVVSPLAFGLLIIALVWPLQARLQRRMPAGLAFLLSALIVLCFGVAFGLIAAWSLTRIATTLTAEMPRFLALYDSWAAQLQSFGIPLPTEWRQYFDFSSFLRIVRNLTSWVNTTATFALVAVVYALLGLLEIEGFRDKVRRFLSPEQEEWIVPVIGDVAAKVRTYMWVRTQMSVLTGIVVFGLAWLLGIEHAFEWGVLTFILNYIPFLGPLIATILVTAYAIVQFGSLYTALLVFVLLNLNQIIIGSYVEPRTTGTALSISPLFGVFAIFFWTYFWGLQGTLIGIPITITMLSLAAAHPATRAIAGLLGGAGAAKTGATDGKAKP